jgi:hypothetical protein
MISYQERLRRKRRNRRRKERVARAAGTCTNCLQRNADLHFATCSPCRVLRTDLSRRFRAKLRGMGLCYRCGSRPDPGNVQCRACIVSVYPSTRARRNHWRNSGRCTRCGRKRDSPRIYCLTCTAKYKISGLKHRREVRKALLARLGNRCACCGESRKEFLTLDHVRDDGYLERRTLKNPYSLYLKIVKRKIKSSRYQLLCANCNSAKASYGRCPHQDVRSAG